MSRVLLGLSVLALVAVPSLGQITVPNTGIPGCAPAAATTTGTTHSVDLTNAMVGAGSCLRSAGPGNASFLPTGIALDPMAIPPSGNQGFTFQWWYRPAMGAQFSYVYGDAAWVGAFGQFRCFQNGVAGTGNLIARGPLTQVATVGAPLTTTGPTGLNAMGWVHIAVVYDQTADTITWYINGVLNNSGPMGITGSGSNFTCMGYNGSAAPGGEGNYDDYRIYKFARTAADIAADFTVQAAGVGPSGLPNLPDGAYYECEGSQNAHIGFVGRAGETLGTESRLFFDGDNLSTGTASPAAGPFAGTTIWNVDFVGIGAAARATAYQALPAFAAAANPVPGLEMGSCISTPIGLPILFPDGAALGSLIAAPCGGLNFGGAYSYGGTTTPTEIILPLPIPPGTFTPGAVVHCQAVGLVDPTYVFGVAVASRRAWIYQPNEGGAGGHFHAEARGVGTIQNTGFFEIWNTGDTNIMQVDFDLTGTAAAGWAPAGLLNSGGTLATEDTYRFNTAVYCDLTPPPGGGTSFLVGGAANEMLTFMFDCTGVAGNGGFEGPQNHFIFDCATTGNGAGNTYIGATVTVTFCDNTMLSGQLIADPADPEGAILDL